MRKLALLVVLLAAGLVATSAARPAASKPSAATWRVGFERTSAPWQNLQVDETVPLAESFAYVSPGRTGKYAARFVAKQGYGPSWGLEGVDECCGPPNEGVPGTDEWWAWSDKFAPSWREPYHWGITLQFHAGDDMTPPLAFDVGANSMWLDVRTGEANPAAMDTTYQSFPKVLTTLSKGHWNDYVFHVRWAAGNTGVLELWHRVPDRSKAWKKLLTRRGIPTLQSRGGNPDHIYVEIGVYRDSYCAKPVSHGCQAESGSPSAHQPDSVYYADNLVRGSSFGQVTRAAWGRS